MTSWADFQVAAPDLAALVEATFAVRKHATMATVRRDGAPRISGTEVLIGAGGEVVVQMMPGTRRTADLRRGSRVELHSPTEDPPDDDPAAWLGESKISARAEEVHPDQFQLDLQRVVLTRIAGGALEISEWRPGAGVVVHRRG